VVQAHGCRYCKFFGVSFDVPDGGSSDRKRSNRCVKPTLCVFLTWSCLEKVETTHEVTTRAAPSKSARKQHSTCSDTIQQQCDVALKQVFEQALREHHDCLTRTSQCNQNNVFDLQAQQMEKSNRFRLGH
jgi:hypothetical protein